MKSPRHTIVSRSNGGGCGGDNVKAAVAGIENDVIGDCVHTINTEENSTTTQDPINPGTKPFSCVNHSQGDALCFTKAFFEDHDERRRWDSIQ